MGVLQITMARDSERLVCGKSVDQRNASVFESTIDAADLGNHNGGIFGL